jgi:DNA-binding response OmpR family regulator
VLSKILFLEDDLLFAQSACDLLEEEGYEIAHCANAKEALELTFSERFDLYLLDINVPVINGVELLSELREAGDGTPAIFVTSYQESDMVHQGFASGCDDYIKKPFDNDELLLRIKALLRRTVGDEIECVGSLRHDKKHKQIWLDTELLALSQKEYMLLVLLMQNGEKTVTKEMIVQTLWNTNEQGSEGAVRVYVTRLKQILGDIAIENVRGVGYRLVLPS